MPRCAQHQRQHPIYQLHATNEHDNDQANNCASANAIRDKTNAPTRTPAPMPTSKQRTCQRERQVKRRTPQYQHSANRYTNTSPGTDAIKYNDERAKTSTNANAINKRRRRHQVRQQMGQDQPPHPTFNRPSLR